MLARSLPSECICCLRFHWCPWEVFEYHQRYCPWYQVQAPQTVASQFATLDHQLSHQTSLHTPVFGIRINKKNIKSDLRQHFRTIFIKESIVSFVSMKQKYHKNIEHDIFWRKEMRKRTDFLVLVKRIVYQVHFIFVNLYLFIFLILPLFLLVVYSRQNWRQVIQIVYNI